MVAGKFSIGTSLKSPPVFDGHNDVLLRLYEAGGLDAAGSFITGREGHIDIAKAVQGGFGGGFFAIYVPSPVDLDSKTREMRKSRYDLALPEQISFGQALPVALAQAAILNRLEQSDALKICTSSRQIRDCLDTGKIAAIMHMEGAEAIDPDFHALDVLYRAGLRSIGPV
jgi:membrane dipeptidase